MTIADIARPEIRALRPYQAASQHDNTVRLNANEAPWTSGADRFSRPLNRYPEIRPAGLQHALASRFRCRPEQLLVTRGTSEAIDLLIRVFCRAGHDNIVTLRPTFSMYAHYAAVQGAAVREVPAAAEQRFAVLADNVLAACNDETRLVFICSPNNPTGNSVPVETIVEILKNRSGRSAVVLDEAYIEFSSRGSSIDLLKSHDNLIVLRTLSKALAFAGARCGAVMGRAEVIDMLDAIQAPYAMSTPVVECVEKALQDDSLREAERRVAEIVAERDRLTRAIAEFTFVESTWPSDANFFLIKVSNPHAVLEQTIADGILLRYFGGELANCLRITVGSREDNDRLLESLAKLG